MIVTLLAPDGHQYQVAWENIKEFSKQACELWISEAKENEAIFHSFKESYHKFSPYYDFLILKLHYIQIGFPFEERLYGLAQHDMIVLKELEEDAILEYGYLSQGSGSSHLFIHPGTDENLGYQDQMTTYKEGFLFQDGSLISIDKLGSHQQIAYTYLLEQMIEDSTLVKTYLKRRNAMVDIREFFYYQLGAALIAGQQTHIAIYDSNLITRVQKEMLDQIDWDPMIQNSILEEFQNPWKENLVRK